MRIQVFPSILEKNDTELKSVFNDFISGIRITHNGEKYIVGNLAVTEGVAPHKIINSSPMDVDYQVLIKSSLLLASLEAGSKINLTVGFPYSTFMMNREPAIEFLKGKHEITYDQFSIGKDKSKTVTVEVELVDVIPEIIGCGFAVRSTKKYQGNIFVVNLGYGTFEACLTTESGIIDRTVISQQGMNYAIQSSMKELTRNNYLGMKTEHQYDLNFQKGYITINRRKYDLSDVRKNALQMYYKEIISPSIRNRWKDHDFETTDHLVLAGGGAYYKDLVDMFHEEFDDILKVEVIDEPHMAVSKGYCIRSVKKFDSPSQAVGIDIGNAQTAVAINQEEIGYVNSSPSVSQEEVE